MLSIIFPSDPDKPDLLSRFRKENQKTRIQADTVRKYRVGDIFKVDDSGTALIWSFDEKYFFYTKKAADRGEEIWVSDLKESKEKINSNIKLFNIRDARWSPDGTMLCFMANISDEEGGIFIYTQEDKTIRDITPNNLSDAGVTSYDWDDDSLFVIMSADVVKPNIFLYNIRSRKSSRLDMSLKDCRNVAFSKDKGIIYSDMDLSSKYKIYTADSKGKNPEIIADGQKFLLSPHRQKIAILSDTDSQPGLWIFDVANGQKKMVSPQPIYDIYWLSNNINLMFSTEEDSLSRYTYRGNIRYMDKDFNTIDVTGAVHTMFVPSKTGKRIAMTSPDFMDDKSDKKGVFIGELYK